MVGCIEMIPLPAQFIMHICILVNTLPEHRTEPDDFTHDLMEERLTIAGKNGRYAGTMPARAPVRDHSTGGIAIHDKQGFCAAVSFVSGCDWTAEMGRCG